MESLHKYIPREALPREYGGTQRAFDNSAWKEEMLKDHEYFERLEEFRKLDGGDGDSPGGVSLDDSNGIQLIDVETEDSEASEPGTDGKTKFVDCDGDGLQSKEQETNPNHYKGCTNGVTGLNNVGSCDCGQMT